MPSAPTVASLLERLDQLEFVAGGSASAREVGRVRSVDGTPDPSSCSSRDLLVVRSALFAGPDGAAMLRDLAARGIAGICLATPTDDLNSEVVAVADDLPLSILQSAEACPPEQLVVVILETLLRHHEELTIATQRFSSITLEELISSDTDRNAQAIERAASIGWDLHCRRAVLLASIDPPVEPGVAERVLETIAASARATLGDDAIVWTRATSVAALLAPVDGSTHERRRLAEALREDLDRRVTSVTLSIGVGRCVDEPADLPYSHVDAGRAVEVGRWAKGRHVTELYDDLGLERLFASVPQSDLHDFVLHAIGPLIDHDRDNRGDLLETLSVWLETRNVAQASREMFVHYNTFKNRLERIEGILGPMLTDAARLLECEVAIYVARHYDGPWARP